MTQKLLLRDPPRCRVIRGRPASCRTCKYVMDPALRLVPAWEESDGVFMLPEHFEVACCREGPPRRFRWVRKDVEPFCGCYEESEGEVVPGRVESHKATEKPRAHADETATRLPPTTAHAPGPVPLRLEVPTFGAPDASPSSGPVTLDRIDLGSVSLSLRPETQD